MVFRRGCMRLVYFENKSLFEFILIGTQRHKDTEYNILLTYKSSVTPCLCVQKIDDYNSTITLIPGRKPSTRSVGKA